MAIYLKQFSTHAEYDAYINGSGAILPNVSICTTEGDVHYNPYVAPPETRVVAKFNVTDTSNPTPIGYNDYISGFSAIEIDGVVQPSVVSAYTFTTTGEHTVKYTLTDPTSVGFGAFYECSSLTSIDIPDGVTSIGNGVFVRCNSLTSVDIPSGVTSIGDNTFIGCSSLTSIGLTGSGASVEIPDSVTHIGFGAFQYCTSLTSITMGSSVININSQAFISCNSLTSITFYAVTPPTLISNNAFDDTNNCPIYVPSTSVNAYKVANNWKRWSDRIQAIP